MGRGLTARILFVLYLGALVAATLIHVWWLLAAALLLAVTLAGPARWHLLRRTLLSALAFNLAVSAGYAVMAVWQGTFSAQYLLLLNSRVLLMVFLGFWFIARVDLPAVVSGSPGLSFLLTVAVAQALVLRRQVHDFEQAFTSRNPRRPRTGDRLRHAAAQGQHLLDQSLHAADETALAMRSRACFDD